LRLESTLSYNTGMPEQPTPTEPGATNEEWFRAPNAREHKIAGALFVGFGIFFLLLSIVWRGLWFHWVLVVLGGYSILAGVRHVLDARRAGKS
jgi:hypothetical protein